MRKRDFPVWSITLLDIQEFINILKVNGELSVISAEVDPRFEIAEIHRRTIEAQGPALLFSKVKGSDYPVVTNLFGTAKRVELAFGTDALNLMQQVSKLPEECLPPSLGKLWQKRSLISKLLKVGTSKPRNLGSEYITEEPKLTGLPALTTWPLDGGPFLTLPLVYTEHPRTKIHNLGMYRIQIFDDATTGLHCQIGKGGGFHLSEAGVRGEKLPVTIMLGGPPALILGAIAPLPENLPELLVTSLVQGKRLKMMKSNISPHSIVDGVEFALVGEVDPNERRPEGPFGDHYGYYSLKHDYPVFHCKKVIRKKSPIFPATVVGKPRQEDFYIGNYLQKLLSPLFPLVMPSVKDLWSYGETGFHSLAAAVVNDRYEREALVSAFRILGEGQLSLTKFLLVLNEPRDLNDFRGVLEHVLERADFRKDLYVFSNTSMDTLDYAGPKVNHGSKGVLLGCGEKKRDLPKKFVGELPKAIKRVKEFCGGCLVVEGCGYSQDKELAKFVSQIPAFHDWPLVILVDDAEAVCASEEKFLWSVFTRFEPAADIYSRENRIVRHHITYEVPVVIDARVKPWYPGVVEADSGTVKLVDGRWKEYGIS